MLLLYGGFKKKGIQVRENILNGKNREELKFW